MDNPVTGIFKLIGQWGITAASRYHLDEGSRALPGAPFPPSRAADERGGGKEKDYGNYESKGRYV